jgi:hypothetical protein
MSNNLSREEIIKAAQDWDYAYSDYQIESYIVNTGVTDWRKAKQCLIEIEQRQQSYEDIEFAGKKNAAEIEIKKEELQQEESPAKRSLIEIEIREKEVHLERNQRRLKGIKQELDRFIEQFQQYASSQDDIKLLNESSPEEERKYWIARMAKQGAMEMLAYGKIGAGNMESLMQMPTEDSFEAIHGALDYTKKMETGIIALEKEVEHNLIEQLKQSKDEDITIPKLTDSVAKNAKLLGSSKS